MPSPNKTLCVFGDSHIGSVRKALDTGALSPAGVEIEFFGATGEDFRQINLVDDVIRPQTDAATEVVKTVNGKGRTTLTPGDFDIVLVYGARLRMSSFFPPLLHRMTAPNGFMSDAVLRAAARRTLLDCRAARLARWLAADGRTRVVFAPTPFVTWGVVDHQTKGRTLALFPGVDQATAQDRARLWSALRSELAADGVTFLPQPDHTIVHGVFTDQKYAVEDAAQSGDISHKSPEFAAIMVTLALESAHAKHRADHENHP